MLKATRFVIALGISLLASGLRNAQTVVVDRDAIASRTFVSNAKEASVTSGVWFAYVHSAVLNAVNAIDHCCEPYLFSTKALEGASEYVAAVAAAHRSLDNSCGLLRNNEGPFSVDSLVTHAAHTFTTTNDLLTEVEHARIYAGFHYHHSVLLAKVLGTNVAHPLTQRFFRPAN